MVCLEDAHKMSLTAQKWETYRFTSKEWDEETGLYSFPARYYEPRLSRWMSADPSGFDLINPMDSDGKPRKGYNIVEALNWYSYVSNNPVKYVDPTGMEGVVDPPTWEDKYEDYSESVKDSIRDRTAEEEEEFSTNTDPALIEYTEEELAKLLEKYNTSEEALSEKESEILDLLNAYHHALKAADDLEGEMLINLIPTPAPGKSGHDLTEYVIPELIESYKDIFSIPGHIDVAVSEYASLSRTRDSIAREYIGQLKIRQW